MMRAVRQIGQIAIHSGVERAHRSPEGEMG